MKATTTKRRKPPGREVTLGILVAALAGAILGLTLLLALVRLL